MKFYAQKSAYPSRVTKFRRTEKKTVIFIFNDGRVIFVSNYNL